MQESMRLAARSASGAARVRGSVQACRFALALVQELLKVRPLACVRLADHNRRELMMPNH